MAANDNQFGGGGNSTVADVDIAAEQAALANAEAQATATIEAANPTAKVEVAPADDKTPAQKQADEAHKKEETDSEFSYDAFLAQKNTPAKLPEVATKTEPAKVQTTPTPVLLRQQLNSAT